MLDLRAGYHHILLDKSSIPKTAFNSPFGKYEYIKVPFGLAQAPAYFQELMTSIPKNFNFAIAYLDDIIIFSNILEEHLSQITMVCEKLWLAKLSMKMSKFLFQGNPVFREHSKHHRHSTTTIKNTCHTTYATTHYTQTSLSISWISWLLQKIYKGLCQNSKTINIAYTPMGKVWLDTVTPYHFSWLEGGHNTSGNTALPRP